MPFKSLKEALNEKIQNHPQLFEAAQKQNLVIFLGAGFSRLFGLPGWDQLANRLIDVGIKAEKLDFKDKKVIQGFADNKKKISILKSIFKENGMETLFHEELAKALLPPDEKLDIDEVDKAFSALRDLGGYFVTTNADPLFDKQFIERKIVREYDLEDAEPIWGNLYKIHGSIFPDGKLLDLVFTVSEYFQRYNQPKFKGFLKRLFTRFHVLFIGYGLGEFELLDYILKDSKWSDGGQTRHFALEGYLGDEEARFKADQYYFSDLGVKVIPFLKDQRDYHQQLNILKDWANEVEKKSPRLKHGQTRIQRSFRSPRLNSKLSTIQMLLAKDAYVKVFLNYIRPTRAICEWTRLFFEVEESKLVLGNFPTENEPSHYQLLRSDILFLLHRNLEEKSETMALSVSDKSLAHLVLNSYATLKVEIGTDDWQVMDVLEQLVRLIIVICPYHFEDKWLIYIRYYYGGNRNHHRSFPFFSRLLPSLISLKSAVLLDALLLILEQKNAENGWGKEWILKNYDKDHTHLNDVSLLELHKFVGNHLGILVLQFDAAMKNDHDKFNSVGHQTLSTKTNSDSYSTQLIFFFRKWIHLAGAENFKEIVDILSKGKFLSRFYLDGLKQFGKDNPELVFEFFEQTENPLNETVYDRAELWEFFNWVIQQEVYPRVIETLAIWIETLVLSFEWKTEEELRKSEKVSKYVWSHLMDKKGHPIYKTIPNLRTHVEDWEKENKPILIGSENPFNRALEDYEEEYIQNTPVVAVAIEAVSG